MTLKTLTIKPCPSISEKLTYQFETKMMKDILDLENHFSIYRAYHRNPMNIIIHNIFVWPIFFNSLILFYFTPPLFQLPFFGGLHINFAFLAVLFYSLFCIALDSKAGSLAALLCLLCWFGSQLLAASLGFSLAWKVVLASLLLSWMGQSIGHGVFEKQAPALLDNISLAFLMAPFFVLLEVFFPYIYIFIYSTN
ncbi:hypothetical protein IEQ34_019810 [Dendrobium chrysotoxum]|uniref:Uncharacterized protein n=1 Tax=Dendrobium chrysotoxum TaxID=161865 RepID=A0AAV7G8I1_DENCH|nr:hypothetical protein IEQ34_019810 [Dendrobium chrysotoxum]